MNDEAAVAAFEKDLLFEVPESATPRIPPEDDKEPFTSFGKVKLKNPDQTGNPKRNKWLPGIHDLLLYVGTSRNSKKGKAQSGGETGKGQRQRQRQSSVRMRKGRRGGATVAVAVEASLAVVEVAVPQCRRCTVGLTGQVLVARWN